MIQPFFLGSKNQLSDRWSDFVIPEVKGDDLPGSPGRTWDPRKMVRFAKNSGKTPKMDGENHGKAYEQMDDLGFYHYFWKHPYL